MILMALQGISQERKELETANMQRAIEAYSNNDLDEMQKWLNAEINQNPKNGYAFSWLASIFNYQDEYGYAISAAEKALKYIPRRDKVYVVFAYTTRANVYIKLKEYDKAHSDFAAAIKVDPKEKSIYKSRGELYYNMQQYDLSDKDFKTYVQLTPSDPIGYVGLGRNMKERDNCDEAIKMFDQAVKLRGSDYSSGYSFRAECLIKLGRFDEAASDIVTALQIDHDNKAYYLLHEIADSSYRTIVSRLKVQADKENNTSEWLYYLGVVSYSTKRYDKAIEYFTNAFSIDGNDVCLYQISKCYSELGNMNMALKYADDAIERDSTDLHYRVNRATILYELDRIPEAIQEYDFCIEQNDASQWYYYYRRGWYKELNGDRDGAIEDYTMCITQHSQYPYVYMSRGQLLQLEGEEAAARKDFRKCIELDTVNMNKMTCAFYAYHFLGDDRNAVRLLDTLLAHEGSFYEAVCLYSRMGQKDKAIEYLRKAFENGYHNFTHLERDDDVDNIRNEKEFKDLVAQYKRKYETSFAEEQTESIGRQENITEIPFKRRGGVTEVNCKINGLPLYFIFDTGAGDVTISSVEAAFMFKNGYLSRQDVIGRANYVTASGDIVEGTVINLSEITIGDISLSNVRASVVKGQNAPLLLGQSVLSRLGKIEIDNQRSVIKVTYYE